MTAGGNVEKVPMLAFTEDKVSAEVLRAFFRQQGWAEECVHTRDSQAAVSYLGTHPSPHVLCIDIPSVESASAILSCLADVCDPDVKVIVLGNINEYSFYCWLTEVGITHYVLKPCTVEKIEAAYHAAITLPVIKEETKSTASGAKVIAVIGSRGGVGATTVSVNMAWILAHELQQKTALLDCDPQLGTVALALDLEPGRGLRDALEKPERIDGLFLDRVMLKIDDHLSVLSTEESLDEHINISETAVEALLRQARSKFSYIIVDVPRVLSPFTRYLLKHADHTVCVTELSIMGLRESLRYLDYCRDTLKAPIPIFIANRVGMAGKHQVLQEEFEKGLGAKITYSIPFAVEAYAVSATGQVLAENAKHTPIARSLYNVAAHFVEGAVEERLPSPWERILAVFKKGR